MSRTDFYSRTSFECRRCRKGCCSLFEVTVSAAEKERLEKLSLPGAPPADEWFIPDGKGNFLLCKNAAGQCVLRGDDGLCLIHKYCSYNAKPLSCRVFPLHIQHWTDGRISANYRFICPGAGYGRAKPLESDPGQIAKLGREMAQRQSVSCAVYSVENPANLQSVRFVHDAFKALLHDSSRSWKLRLYTAARILDFHSGQDMRDAVRQADETFAADAVSFAQKAVAALEKELSDGVADALTRTNFRNMMCGFLRQDAPGIKHTLLYRIKKSWTQFRFAVGTGSMSGINPAAPDLPGIFFPWRGEYHRLTTEGEEIFCDFFFGRLDAMHFCGGMTHNYSYEEGMRHLLLSACIIFALANACAEKEHSESIQYSHMRPAVELADFTFSRSPFFRLKTAGKWCRQLLKPQNFAGLLNECARF